MQFPAPSHLQSVPAHPVEPVHWFAPSVSSSPVPMFAAGLLHPSVQVLSLHTAGSLQVDARLGQLSVALHTPSVQGSGFTVIVVVEVSCSPPWSVTVSSTSDVPSIMQVIPTIAPVSPAGQPVVLLGNVQS